MKVYTILWEFVRVEKRVRFSLDLLFLSKPPSTFEILAFSSSEKQNIY